VVQFAFDALPSSDKNDGLCGVTSGSLQNPVEILSAVLLTGCVVGVALAADFDPEAL
jgi:hypothetical protein